MYQIVIKSYVLFFFFIIVITYVIKISEDTFHVWLIKEKIVNCRLIEILTILFT